jgi:membrane protein YdbS with pleckstrin-like domain
VPRERFVYDNLGFRLTSLLLVLLSTFILGFFLFMGGDVLVLVGVMIICILMVFFYGISPLLSYHFIEEGDLVLNQGIFFRARIPMKKIRSVEPLDTGPSRTGVFFLLRRSVLYVTTRRHDLIVIKLDEPRRFGMIFGKKVDQIVFDVQDQERMVEVLKERITPANPDLLS